MDGKKAAIPTAMICKVQDGKIMRFDEYLDSAQVAQLVRTISRTSNLGGGVSRKHLTSLFRRFDWVDKHTICGVES